MREYWAIAELHLIYCVGIAEKNTNVNAQVIEQVASMIRTEQDAVKEGILEKDSFDPNISNLTVDDISARLKSALAMTNTPSVGIHL